MGCTGSKYHTLNGDQVAVPDATQNSSAASGVPQPYMDSRAEEPPSVPSSPPPAAPGPGNPSEPHPAAGSQRPGTVRPPPWGASSQSQLTSSNVQFEPPLAESGGDDSMDLEPPSENLEEKFPPWKDTDQAAPTRNDIGVSQLPPDGALPLTPQQPSACQPAVAPASEAWEVITNFENTVIIYDWDDTLLCSSALHCCLPNQFLELEEIVETTLLMSMSLGRTIIVTNAMESWIQETARRFMPRLLPTLERLLIVYARKKNERLWPGDTFAWKREAFRELMTDRFGHDINLLVIGDSLSEIRAAEALVDRLGSSALVKTVKFKALPSPSDLLGELRTIGPELGRLVEARCSSTKELCQEAPSGIFNGMPVGMFQSSPNWLLLDSVPCDTDTPPPGILTPQHLLHTQQLWNVIPGTGTQITTI